MEKTVFPESELIINGDGSIFHLHLHPTQLADKVILVGDPARVTLVASHFDSKECEVSNREFHTITGMYHGKRITVQSTGIGCDNCDIVINEMDALANIDFQTRTEKAEHRTLTFVRIGTCGGLQPYTPTGTFIVSVKSIGFDGLLNFYAGRDQASDLALEKAFKEHVGWKPSMGNPMWPPLTKSSSTVSPVMTWCGDIPSRATDSSVHKDVVCVCHWLSPSSTSASRVLNTRDYV